jgi:hypothetical protein
VKLYRPTTVLVGVLFVLLGGVTRLATPDQVYENTNREVVHGTIGEQIQYGDSSVTVNRVRFAKSFLASETAEKAVQTDGIFVAVEYDAVRGTADPGGNSVTLTADGGSVYEPVSEGSGGSGIPFPAPGFAETGVLLFEVNPADIKGLTMKVEETMLFTVLGRDLAVDLGVPSEEIAQQLMDQGTDEYLLPKSSTRVAG